MTGSLPTIAVVAILAAGVAIAVIACAAAVLWRARHAAHRMRPCWPS